MERSDHILVTGGAGFIGSHLVDLLVADGHSVVVIDTLESGQPHRPVGADLIVGSIVDPAVVDEAFERAPFDAVYHLAAFAAEGMSHLARHHNYSTNVLGSVNLINRAVETGIGSFVFASSVAVYGHGAVPMSESDQIRPADSYGISKYCIELELAAMSAMHGIPHVALRMHNVFGSRQNLRDPYRNAVAIFLNQIMREEPITVYGDGRQVRAFTFIDDIVDVIVQAGDRAATLTSDPVFNVGSSRPVTVWELAEAVAGAMGVPDHPIQLLPARSEVAVAYTDTTKAQRVFGPWPETDLDTGLAATARWAREVGPSSLVTTVRPELSARPEWARHVDQRLEQGTSAKAEPIADA